MKTLIWDFDGTLGYREGVWWAMSFLELLDREWPGHPFTRDQIAPHLRSGFPWHSPEQPHTHITSADQWWAALEPLFAVLDETQKKIANEIFADTMKVGMQMGGMKHGGGMKH